VTELVSVRLVAHGALPNMPIDEWAALLVQLPDHFKWCALKTWLGSWITAYRMHESRLLGCVFGCQSAPDSWHHYLRCPGCWYLVSDACGQPFVGEYRERVPLLLTTREGIKSTVVAFTAYHKIKGLTMRNGNLSFDELERVVRACAAQI